MAARSPCIGACALDVAAAICLGCGRTLAEIAAWPDLADEERARIMQRLAEAKGGGNGAVPPKPPGTI